MNTYQPLSLIYTFGVIRQIVFPLGDMIGRGKGDVWKAQNRLNITAQLFSQKKHTEDYCWPGLLHRVGAVIYESMKYYVAQCV